MIRCSSRPSPAASEIAGDPVRAGEAYAEAAYLNGRPEQALVQLNTLKKRSDVDYYARSRIDARIAAITPTVLELRGRASATRTCAPALNRSARCHQTVTKPSSTGRRLGHDLAARCRTSMQKRILIVDDEPAIRDMVAFALRKAEFEPVHAGDAREAQAAIADRIPDLILLDWMLPGTSGLELARRWRRDALTREIPIIMLTARGEENDRVGGLEAGVDDYVVKPFSARELLARIRAVMRRSHEDDDDGSVAVGGLRIDGAAHRVFAASMATTRRSRSARPNTACCISS